MNTDSETRLSICLQSDGFSFSLLGGKRQMLALEENLPLPQGGSAAIAADLLARLDKQYGVSPLGLGGMRLVVPAGRFAWVPSHLFDPQRSRQYLDLVGQPDITNGGSPVHILNNALGAYMVFEPVTDAVTFFKVSFPGIDVHCSHSLLVTADLLRDSAARPLMLLHIARGRADVEAFYSGRLLLSNSFPVANADEALYFAIDIMKRLHLETPDMELRLCGEVDRAVYARYQRYFPNVGLHVGVPVVNSDPTAPAVPTYKYPLLLN